MLALPPLPIQPLKHSFDGQVYLAASRKIHARSDPTHDRFQVLRHFSLFDEFAQGPGDILQSSVENVLADICHKNLDPGLSTHLGNPTSH
jgi:hypothetical protein